MSVQRTTLSGEPIRALYTETDLPPDAEASIGLPGEYPFTRGVYPSMYRGRDSRDGAAGDTGGSSGGRCGS